MKLRITDYYTVYKEMLIELPDEIEGTGNTLEYIKECCSKGETINLDKLGATCIDSDWGDPDWEELESTIKDEDGEYIDEGFTEGKCLNM